jgi:hypothetical protein
MGCHRPLRERGRGSRWPTNVLVTLGITVSLGLMAISAVLNFGVGYTTADAEFDGLVYRLSAAMADGLKAIAPFVAGWGRCTLDGPPQNAGYPRSPQRVVTLHRPQKIEPPLSFSRRPLGTRSTKPWSILGTSTNRTH